MNTLKKILLKKIYGALTKSRGGLPGGPVVRKLTTNAGDMGSIPAPGRCHEQLSPRATTTEPGAYSSCSTKEAPK